MKNLTMLKLSILLNFAAKPQYYLSLSLEREAYLVTLTKALFVSNFSKGGV